MNDESYADQAIFTSLTRLGKAGYHVVAKSSGVTESESHAVATWSPSHGGLAADDLNRVSVNFYPTPSGRFALSRTCEGRGEYSGRGGKQLFTRVILFDSARLKRVGYRPIVIYHDALALGYLHYQPDPPPVLPRVRLSHFFPDRPAQTGSLEALVDPGTVELLVSQLSAGQSVVFPFEGARLELADYLLGQLPQEVLLRLSFATSLVPSAVRPFRLNLVSAR
jgi:hypothetical protein